jgi:hypothetical protein
MVSELVIWIIGILASILVGVIFAGIFIKTWNFIEKRLLKRKIGKQKEIFMNNGVAVDLKQQIEDAKNGN